MRLTSLICAALSSLFPALGFAQSGTGAPTPQPTYEELRAINRTASEALLACGFEKGFNDFKRIKAAIPDSAIGQLGGLRNNTNAELDRWTESLKSTSPERAEDVKLRATCSWPGAQKPCTTENLEKEIPHAPAGVSCEVTFTDLSGRPLADVPQTKWTARDPLRLPAALPILERAAELASPPADLSRVECSADRAGVCYAPQRAGAFHFEVDGCRPVTVEVARGKPFPKVRCQPLWRRDARLDPKPDALIAEDCGDGKPGYCYRADGPDPIRIEVPDCKPIEIRVEDGKPFPAVPCEPPLPVLRRKEPLNPTPTGLLLQRCPNGGDDHCYAATREGEIKFELADCLPVTVTVTAGTPFPDVPCTPRPPPPVLPSKPAWRAPVLGLMLGGGAALIVGYSTGAAALQDCESWRTCSSDREADNRAKLRTARAFVIPGYVAVGLGALWWGIGVWRTKAKGNDRARRERYWEGDTWHF